MYTFYSDHVICSTEMENPICIENSQLEKIQSELSRLTAKLESEKNLMVSFKNGLSKTGRENFEVEMLLVRAALELKNGNETGKTQTDLIPRIIHSPLIKVILDQVKIWNFLTQKK